MTDTARNFQTRAVLAIVSGRATGDNFQECRDLLEHLFGRPVPEQHLLDHLDEAREALLRQHPALIPLSPVGTVEMVTIEDLEQVIGGIADQITVRRAA